KGILPDIHHARHVRRNLPAGPALRLLEELELEIIDPKGAQARPREVEKLMALGRPLVLQEVRLVVAIEVVLVGPVAEPRALEQLVCDVRIAGGGEQGREPVQGGKDAVLDRAWFDLARPTGNARS